MVRITDLTARQRKQVYNFIDQLAELQAQGKDVDAVLQIICDNMSKKEQELIHRLRLMCNGHERSGGNGDQG